MTNTYHLTIVPAYGRDYTTAKAVKEAWNSGQDFIVADFFSAWDGKPVNKDDAEQYAPNTKFMARYSKLTKIVNL